MDFSKKVLELGPWSLSKADLARNCGLKFQWSVIEKKPEPRVAQSAGRIGNAAHKALELTLKGHDLKSSFTVAAVDNRLTTKEVDDLLVFSGTIEAFLGKIRRFSEKHNAKELLVEHQFGLTVDLQRTTFRSKDVFFRGVYDLGIPLGNNDLVLIDHKSGQPSTDISKHTNQLNAYALAGRKLFPALKGVQSAIHYVQDGSLVWGTYIDAATIDENLSTWLVEFLNSAVDQLDGKPRPGWYCNFCGYASQCPAKREGT